MYASSTAESMGNEQAIIRLTNTYVLFSEQSVYLFDLANVKTKLKKKKKKARKMIEKRWTLFVSTLKIHEIIIFEKYTRRKMENASLLRKRRVLSSLLSNLSNKR